MSFHWYHSLADLIWPDCRLNVSSALNIVFRGTAGKSGIKRQNNMNNDLFFLYTSFYLSAVQWASPAGHRADYRRGRRCSQPSSRRGGGLGASSSRGCSELLPPSTGGGRRSNGGARGRSVRPRPCRGQQSAHGRYWTDQGMPRCFVTPKCVHRWQWAKVTSQYFKSRNLGLFPIGSF